MFYSTKKNTGFICSYMFHEIGVPPGPISSSRLGGGPDGSAGHQHRPAFLPWCGERSQWWYIFPVISSGEKSTEIWEIMKNLEMTTWNKHRKQNGCWSCWLSQAQNAQSVSLKERHWKILTVSVGIRYCSTIWTSECFKIGIPPTYILWSPKDITLTRHDESIWGMSWRVHLTCSKNNVETSILGEDAVLFVGLVYYSFAILLQCTNVYYTVYP